MKGLRSFMAALMMPLIVASVSVNNGEEHMIQVPGNPQNHRHIHAQQFRCLHHCFGPIPQKATKVLRDLRRDAESDGGDFKMALLARVREFLLDEVCTVLQEIAASKGRQLDHDVVLLHAQAFLKSKLEDPYKEKNDGQSPYNDLAVARGTFTYFVESHLRSSGVVARFVTERELF